MRWDALFNDLESQLAESDRLSMEAEIGERTRAELAAIELSDRLRGALGCTLGVHLLGGESFHGRLAHAGAEALVIDDDRYQVLIPYRAVARYVGTGRFARTEPSAVRRALGLAHSLRALARDRAELTISLGGSTGVTRLDGVIDRVGKDYVDVAMITPGEARRSRHVGEVSTVPFAALAAIRSRKQGEL
ncbi:hypothetical protein [Pseudarthrobacter chlorophenolicus]|uniref:hypothetical protein n=1 Tax=Pseudarthrobacter chlorophenolicus TaxID=85085 RepID=UPI0005F2E63D|nr:hypothetical protein [Pseudarthrobacter chlorophenolicus]